MGVLRVTTRFQGQVLPGGGVSTFHVQGPFITEEPPLEDVQEIVDAVDAFWSGGTARYLTGLTIFPAAMVEQQQDGFWSEITGYAVPGGQSGGVASTAHPYQTQGLINWRTSTRARWARGRTFLPGVAASAGATAPTGSYVQGWTTSANALIAAIQAIEGPYNLAVFSETQGVATNITSGQCSPNWSVLRSRRQ